MSLLLPTQPQLLSPSVSRTTTQLCHLQEWILPDAKAKSSAYTPSVAPGLDPVGKLDFHPIVQGFVRPTPHRMSVEIGGFWVRCGLSNVTAQRCIIRKVESKGQGCCQNLLIDFSSMQWRRLSWIEVRRRIPPQTRSFTLPLTEKGARADKKYRILIFPSPPLKFQSPVTRTTKLNFGRHPHTIPTTQSTPSTHPTTNKMGRELQKRKRRSSRATIRQPVRRRKALNPSGSAIISQNWNKKETLSQNYRRLGLVAKLGHSAGGVEPDAQESAEGAPESEKARRKRETGAFGVKKGGKEIVGQVYSEARVERDPETGRIVRIIRDGINKAVRPNPLNDPLNRFDEDSEAEGEEDGEEWGGIDEEAENKRPAVIRQLEREANAPREKTVRYQSEREKEWLARLVERHGEDVGAMARDGKLNPMQQTASDIKRRLKKAGLLEG